MHVGVDFYWKCANFKLNLVFNYTFRWPSKWKVLKNPLVLVQQPSYVFGLGGNLGSSSLNSNLEFKTPFNVLMPQNGSHTVGINYLAWISIHTLQNYWLPFNILETYMGYFAIH